MHIHTLELYSFVKKNGALRFTEEWVAAQTLKHKRCILSHSHPTFKVLDLCLTHGAWEGQEARRGWGNG